MPTYRVAIDINVPPAIAFSYIADLPRHSEWATNQATIVAEEVAPMMVGNRYQSTTPGKNRSAKAVLIVTDYNPPNRFAFALRDGKVDSDHLFTFKAQPGGTHLEQVINETLPLWQRMTFWLTYRLVKRPQASQAMQRLKERLEAGSGEAAPAEAGPVEGVSNQ